MVNGPWTSLWSVICHPWAVCFQRASQHVKFDAPHCLLMNQFGSPKTYSLRSQNKHIFCQNCSFTGKSNISKPEVLMSYFLSLICVVECFGENWAKPLQPRIFTSNEISGISLISTESLQTKFLVCGGSGYTYIIMFIYVYSDDIRIRNTISINSSLLSMEGVILIVYVKVGGYP